MPSAILSSAQPGTIAHYAGGSVPPNYLLCNGASYATATYPQLFAVIGYTYGGSGANFNVPNTQRKVLAGSGGTGTAELGNTVGSSGGEENHVLSAGELATHNHPVSDPSHNHYASNNTTSDAYWITVPTGSPPADFSIGNGGGIMINSSRQPQNANSATGITVGNEGSSTGHNTIQPTLVITHMIRF